MAISVCFRPEYRYSDTICLSVSLSVFKASSASIAFSVCSKPSVSPGSKSRLSLSTVKSLAFSFMQSMQQLRAMAKIHALAFAYV